MMHVANDSIQHLYILQSPASQSSHQQTHAQILSQLQSLQGTLKLLNIQHEQQDGHELTTEALQHGTAQLKIEIIGAHKHYKPGGIRSPGRACAMPLTLIGICTIDLSGCCILACAFHMPGQGPPPVSKAPLVDLVSRTGPPCLFP